MHRGVLSVTLSLLGNVVIGAACPGSLSAQGNVTAIITADNHYALYTGTDDGSDLAFIGRNELGSDGDPGAYNWLLPETFDFDPPGDHRLYVVAWDEDAGGPAMWIGEFTLPDGTVLRSDTTSWECICGSGPSPRSGDAPTDDVLAADISSGTFAPPQWSAPNGSQPWAQYAGDTGLIQGLSADDSFIWIDDVQSGSGSCMDHYIVFRSVSPITAGAIGFRRGDSNADGTVDLTDAVFTLRSLFQGGEAPSCADASDADDSGALDLTDAVYTLQFLFLGGAVPPPPGPFGCGSDSTPAPTPFPRCAYPSCN